MTSAGLVGRNQQSAYYLKDDVQDEINQLFLTVAFSSLDEPAPHSIALWADPGTGVYPLTNNRGATETTSIIVQPGTGQISAVEQIDFTPQVPQTGLHVDQGTSHLWYNMTDLELTGGNVNGPVGPTTAGQMAVFADITGVNLAEGVANSQVFVDPVLGLVNQLVITSTGGNNSGFVTVSNDLAVMLCQSDVDQAPPGGSVAAMGCIDSLNQAVVLSANQGNTKLECGHETGQPEIPFTLVVNSDYAAIAPQEAPIFMGGGTTVLTAVSTSINYFSGNASLTAAGTFSADQSIISLNGDVVASAGQVSAFGDLSTGTGDLIVVAGDIRIPATTATEGQIIQNGTLLLHTKGTRSEFFGAGAGNLTTTGSDNTGIGYQSQQAITTGIRNIAVGRSSMAALTNGQDNTAVGANSMLVVTSGVANVGVGTSTLAAITVTESENTAVGWHAGTALTSDFNTCIGSNSGSTLTTGVGNTLLGRGTQSGVSGNTNVVIGADIVLANAAGSDNIMISSVGAGGDNGTIRFGTAGIHTGGSYMQGIYPYASVAAASRKMTIDSDGRLGAVETYFNSSLYFANFGAPYNLAASAGLTQIVPATSLNSFVGFDSPSNGVLRYIGTNLANATITLNINAVPDTIATTSNYTVQIRVSGGVVLGGVDAITSTFGIYKPMSITCSSTLVTNDTVEVYIQNTTDAVAINISKFSINVTAA